jgi:hypothetical protein
MNEIEKEKHYLKIKKKKEKKINV